jgi:long-chain fatty acid transport protein
MQMDEVSINEFEYNTQDQQLGAANVKARYNNKAYLLGVQYNRRF